MESRRPALKYVGKQASTNAGLWLDKFLTAQTEGSVGGDSSEAKGEKAELIKALAGQPAPQGYLIAFRRWHEGLKDEGARLATARVVGRMVIGLGEKGVIEAGVRLDHTWGVPLIPGSALKGLAATTADRLLAEEGWRRTTETGGRGADHARLFGGTDEQGEVTFHDAWWIPEPEGTATLPIHLDVMTVHHPKYYQAAGGDVPPPSDMDSPVPVAFASVSGAYLIALQGEPSSCDLALGILEMGLAELGIGAKTNAGYGRMVPEGERSRALREAERMVAQARTEKQQAERERAEQAQAAAKAEQARRQEETDLRALDQVVRTIAINNAAQEVPRLLKKYGGRVRREFAGKVIVHLGKSLKGRDRQPWVIELLAAAADSPDRQ